MYLEAKGTLVFTIGSEDKGLYKWLSRRRVEILDLHLFIFFSQYLKYAQASLWKKKKVKWNFNVTEKMWKPTQNIDSLRGCEMSR